MSTAVSYKFCAPSAMRRAISKRASLPASFRAAPVTKGASAGGHCSKEGALLHDRNPDPAQAEPERRSPNNGNTIKE